MNDIFYESNYHFCSLETLIVEIFMNLNNITIVHYLFVLFCIGRYCLQVSFHHFTPLYRCTKLHFSPQFCEIFIDLSFGSLSSDLYNYLHICLENVLHHCVQYISAY